MPIVVIGRICKSREYLLAFESRSFYIIRRDEMSFRFSLAPAEDGVA